MFHNPHRSNIHPEIGAAIGVAPAAFSKSYGSHFLGMNDGYPRSVLDLD
jgi:hypothetical protein